MEALIGCRFEETHQGHDEAVRARIMQVLVGCLEGGAGTWLPDEVVWEVLQTCMANLDQMVSFMVPRIPSVGMGVLFFLLIEESFALSVGRHLEEAIVMQKYHYCSGKTYLGRPGPHMFPSSHSRLVSTTCFVRGYVATLVDWSPPMMWRTAAV